MRRFLVAALLLAACGGTALGPSPSTPPTRHPSPTPDLIDQMMGAPPDTTVFVASGHELLAVTLLNHFVRYRLPLGDEPQVTASVDGARVYVADRVGAGLRLRWFDLATGTLRVQRTETGRVVSAASRGAIAADADRLYVLEDHDGRTVLQAYDGVDLRPARSPFDTCRGQVFASYLRVAVLCTDGELLSLPAAGPAARGRTLSSPITAVAMAPNGSVVVAQHAVLERIRADAVTAERLEPIDWTKILVAREGLAFADDHRLVLADANVEQLFTIDVTTYRARGLPIPNKPANGILAAGQFAYWVAEDASGVYHLDLESGLVERMFGPLQVDATLAGLSVR